MMQCINKVTAVVPFCNASSASDAFLNRFRGVHWLHKLQYMAQKPILKSLADSDSVSDDGFASCSSASSYDVSTSLVSEPHEPLVGS